MRSSWHGIPIWSLAVPALAIGVLAAIWGGELGWSLVGLVAVNPDRSRLSPPFTMRK
jgi:hypothetical protein